MLCFLDYPPIKPNTQAGYRTEAAIAADKLPYTTAGRGLCRFIRAGSMDKAT